MALRPILKAKVDELFLSWLSEPETQHLLKTNLRQILKREPLTEPPPASRGLIQQSPRMRPGSPATPPCSPTVASPRSPRRPHGNRGYARTGVNMHKLLRPGEEREVAVKPVSQKQDAGGPQARPDPAKQGDGGSLRLPEGVTVGPARPEAEGGARRGQPDGRPEGDAFLRQKEAQLREKRHRELRDKEQRGQVKAISKETDSVSAPSPANSVAEDADKGRVKPDDSVPPGQRAANGALHGPQVTQVTQGPQGPQASPAPSAGRQGKASASQPQPRPAAKASAKTAGEQNHVRAPEGGGAARLGAGVATIPPFYFPQGRPVAGEDLEGTAQRIKEAFAKMDGGKAQKADMGTLAKSAGFPFYWKQPLFLYAGGEKNGHVTLQSFLAAWKKLVSSCHDDASRFLRLLAMPGKSFLTDDDFLPLIQDVVETHPGLSFLQDAPEFHSRYVQTVVSRIIYSIQRAWTGRVTVTDLRRGALLRTLKLLEEEEDINRITEYFSYEHFYVVYCKFWELDKDHDLFIDAEDLGRHNEHAISSRMIERIFSGAVTRTLNDAKMSYKDFVWFLISEEDKKHPTSIEYWFRCMDLDGDGYISMYEMEYFYEEQVQKMEALGIETLPFEDCLCQMLDMIKPRETDKISLGDLKACKMTNIFFDTFFNLEKYLEHEQKDPFASDQDGEEELSDWQRYAAEEYEILVAEEGANEMHEEILYEDDFEPDDDDDLVSPKAAERGGEAGEPGKREAGEPGKRKAVVVKDERPLEENIYDIPPGPQDNIGF